MCPEFHPIVAAWFNRRFQEPSEPQRRGWPAIQRGENVLIAAPTGSGKTLAAFLCAIDALVKQGLNGELKDQTRVVYVSPLKALANDIRLNLLEPLKEIQEEAARAGLQLPEIRPLVRTGDTLNRERELMKRLPPHLLITTPESLFILLTSSGGREILKSVRSVIVDEIHAVVRDKRGSHLALSLERLEALCGVPLQRIGLSATQKPIEAIARFLSGCGRPMILVDAGHQRVMDLGVEVPRDELSAVASNEMWEEVYDRLAELISRHRTTLVFVNTRRLAERVAHHLEQRVGPRLVAAHHGSLSRKIRLDVEEQLKTGKVRALVATASLELGIDIGFTDLVCQIGSPRSISTALQRVGRSGHFKGAVPKGRFFATTRDELLECAALVEALRSGELDQVGIPKAPLDILAQQIVAAAACEEWDEGELFELVRRSSSYAELTREQFDAVLEMLSAGIATRRSRRSAYLHRDRVNGKIRARRGARLVAVTCGGAIPDTADYRVKADPGEVLVGTVDEDFAVESMRGDIFLLGTTSWRIRRVEAGVLRVEDAHGAAPSVPFWRGEAPARTDELSLAFARLRQRVSSLSPDDAVDWLMRECLLDRRGAEQAADYIQAGVRCLTAVPSQQCVIAERFFDEAGGMQLILHAPFGARINKAWGLALRKRFCRSFNFELQAAATDNGILISLSEAHSFPLESVFSFLSVSTVQEVLTQAVLNSPLFNTRWRWNAARALGVLRFSGGRKVPPPLQRLRSEDLLGAVFPDQLACAENLSGDIEIPDHPLVSETLRDCLTEAMDLEGLTRVLQQIESGSIRCVAVDTREPSPLSHEVLHANPYAFLDDAPLEERRARAVQTRRSLREWNDPQLGALDPHAITQVTEEVRLPLLTRDEVHDALLTLGIIPEAELSHAFEMLQHLMKEQRAFKLTQNGSVFWTAAERLLLMRKLYPQSSLCPEPDEQLVDRCCWPRDRELGWPEGVKEIIRSWLEISGPVTSTELMDRFKLSEREVETALHELEGAGQVLRGNFRSGTTELEWCDRRLLARIHRLTLGNLRREIEAVTPAQFIRFLFRWQHVEEGTRLFGEHGLSTVLQQLEGFEVPASAWESAVLPSRVGDYEPELLDGLCLSGRFSWGRLTLPAVLENEMNNPDSNPGRVRPSRLAPISFFRRNQMEQLFELKRRLEDVSEAAPESNDILTHPAREVLEQLRLWGACFFDDLVRTTRRLAIEVEEALWELVTAGLVTADGFDNLRALINPKRRRGEGRERGRRPRHALGRWTLLRLPGKSADDARRERDLEHLARLFLARWGIVFRDLLLRESLVPPWRDLLMIYRRLESRGEIRGGRFVSGFTGEQFASAEALDALRAVKRMGTALEPVRISAADPLNLTGIVTPGPRIRPHPQTILLYRDGAIVPESIILK
ncbi:MAG: DEAD/DEAH box helicase [Acidobacteria bacterium]|nr:DEAD/DEAH box helicase [Acidobacteriota bacterium]